MQPLNIISWNLAHRRRLWNAVLDAGADVALLQEACEPPPEVAARIRVDPEPWRTEGAGRRRPWRTSIAQISARVQVRWHAVRSIGDANPGELAVSRVGTLSAAEVQHPGTGEAITLLSMYAPWEDPHTSTGSRWIYSDASVHRLISDLSVFIGRERGHRVIAAGDLNILHGYGEDDSAYWASRYETIFKRFGALGLRFVGPQFPRGRRADPWPDELPRESLNVPTFHTSHQTCETATRQLDFVFASAGIAKRIAVSALNAPEEWGESDHCKIRIVVS